MEYKLLEFNQENANYEMLIQGIEEGKIVLDEIGKRAIIAPGVLETKFALGMKAYLQNHGYVVRVT